MHEVIADIQVWRRAQTPIALATVIETWGSAPRKAGAKMAVTPAGQLAGSVSGGCVEGAVYEEAVAAVENGRAKLLTFGVADETAWDVGLACGGRIQIFVQGLNEAIYTAVETLLQQEQAAVVATVIGVVQGGDKTWLGRQLVWANGRVVAGGIAAEVDHTLPAHLAHALGRGHGQRIAVAGLDIFLDVLLPPPQLIMVGGVHIAVALASMGKALGYRTIVVDPRRAFGNEERFPHVDLLIPQWPEKAFKQLVLNENTAVALLTHDPKIDDPALKIVLDSPVFYVGALGSKPTHAKRVARLQEAGLSEQAIGRIHGPIGLSLNAQTPEEIALSILAQMVQVRRGAGAL